MTERHTILLATPSVDDYRRLRAESGLSPKTEAAALRGLPNSLFAVQILHEGHAVGMGRVIGDGGCVFQVVDIAVLPAHQGQGLGKRIMAEVMRYLEAEAPESAYVSLIADGPAKDLYAQFGFVPTAPLSIGMAWKRQGS
ncbi:GNAT family N-acetyltransferase [Roseateles toxinivorans]|nr:GNAT family N-acetyltransferase [Roseateles toxinivorans]